MVGSVLFLGLVNFLTHGLRIIFIQGEQEFSLPQAIREGCHQNLVVGLIDGKSFLVEAGYV